MPFLLKELNSAQNRSPGLTDEIKNDRKTEKKTYKIDIKYSTIFNPMKK